MEPVARAEAEVRFKSAQTGVQGVANGRQPDMRKVAADLVLPSRDYAQLQEAGGTYLRRRRSQSP